MPDDIHFVALPEIHEGVGPDKIIAVRAFPWMDELPLQVILRGDLVELFLDESNVVSRQLSGSTTRRAGRHVAVDGRADQKMALVNVL